MEVTLVVGELLTLEVNDLINGGIEEIPGVGHDNDRDVKILDVVFEPNESWKIQMIRWLVQHKNLRFTEDDLGNGDSHSPPAREGIRRLMAVFLAESDTFQDLHGFRFRCVGFDHFEAIRNIDQALRVLCQSRLLQRRDVFFYELCLLSKKLIHLNIAIKDMLQDSFVVSLDLLLDLQDVKALREPLNLFP